MPETIKTSGEPSQEKPSIMTSIIERQTDLLKRIAGIRKDAKQVSPRARMGALSWQQADAALETGDMRRTREKNGLTYKAKPTTNLRNVSVESTQGSLGLDYHTALVGDYAQITTNKGDEGTQETRLEVKRDPLDPNKMNYFLREVTIPEAMGERSEDFIRREGTMVPITEEQAHQFLDKVEGAIEKDLDNIKTNRQREQREIRQRTENMTKTADIASADDELAKLV